MVPLEIIEGPYKVTFLSFVILLEPNEYNMVDLDRVWKSKANSGFLANWKFTNFDYLVSGTFTFSLMIGYQLRAFSKNLFVFVILETNYVPMEMKSYLEIPALRSERASNAQLFLVDVSLPSILG